jgi:hypothetical protein
MIIEFEQQNKGHINIIGIDSNGARQLIGHIFTPSGSGKTYTNAIQICGFDDAFDLWGCGVFGDVETKQMKKDIQLKFSMYKPMEENDINDIIVKEEVMTVPKEDQEKLGMKVWTKKVRKSRFSFNLKDGICGKCFNFPCTCENLASFENPYTVKREQDLWLEKVEDKKSSSNQNKGLLEEKEKEDDKRIN